MFLNYKNFKILLSLTALGLIHINQPARVTQQKSILNNFLTQLTNSKAIECRCLLTKGSTVKLNYSNVQKIQTALVFFQALWTISIMALISNISISSLPSVIPQPLLPSLQLFKLIINSQVGKEILSDHMQFLIMTCLV